MRTCGLANYITAILPLRKAKSEGHIDVDCCWSSIAQEEETLRRKIDLTSRGNRLVFKVIVSKKELPLVGAGRTSWQGSNCTEGINRFRESRSVCDWQLLRAKAIPRPLPTRKTKDKSASPLWRRLLPMPTYLSPERKRKASLFFPFDSIRRRRPARQRSLHAADRLPPNPRALLSSSSSLTYGRGKVYTSPMDQLDAVCSLLPLIPSRRESSS